MNSTFVFVQADMEIFNMMLQAKILNQEPPNRLYQDLCFKAFCFSTAHLIQCLSDFQDLFGCLTLAYLVVAVAELHLQELASNFFTLGF